MTKEELIYTLKEDLKVRKEVIGVKAMKEAPRDIPQYEGQAIPGMCALLGEILKEGFVRYITKENLGCFESLTGTGTCANLPRDEYLEFMISQNQIYPMHKDTATLMDYHSKVSEFFKYPKVEGKGIVIGPLAGVDEPDLVFLFVTPHQTDILNRCRAYFGDFTRGFGGSGSCVFNIRYPFLTGEPSFSASDTAWRVFAGLGEDELTYTFPYEKLLAIGERIKPMAEYINNFKSMFSF
jgi:uncharacterized protein (DUF169 family)